MRLVLISLLSITCFLVITSTSTAQDKGFGMGLIVGEPTGISFKGWLSSSTAFDAGVAWSFARGSALHIHADYLIHSFDAIKSEAKVPIYYGIGGRFKAADRTDARLGARGVVGIAYFLPSAPIDLFFEVAPILDFAPATEFSVNGGFGARYFFR